MITLRTISFWSMLDLIIHIFSSTMFIGMALYFFSYLKVEHEKHRTSFILGIVSLILSLVTGFSTHYLIKAKFQENVTLLKNLKFEKAQINKQEVTCLYFSDDEGKIHEYIDGENVSVISNINNTEYTIEFTDDEIIVNVPWTEDALNYAKYRTYGFWEHGGFSYGLILMLIGELIISIIGFFVQDIKKAKLKNILSTVCTVLMIVVIPVFSFCYSSRELRIQRQKNMDIVNSLEIVQNDLNRNIYCADETGLVYIFNENELPVNFEYNINYKDFILYEDNIKVPFK